jgi:sulfite reductase (NADPH) flavoprotein alpha-component
VLPDSAPFTPAQRAWLNGYFAGLLSRGVAAASPGETSAPPSAPAAAEEDESMPWHDPSLPMEDRLKLADGKPIDRRLMSAMAQLDCGACGYECKTYAEAIAAGEEKDLTRCAPGGRETAKKLKELVAMVPLEQLTIRGAPAASPTAPAPAAPATPAHDRRRPFSARLLKNHRLNGPASPKDTRLIVFDLHGSGLTYKAGDALGIIPENCPDTVGWLLEALDASGVEPVSVPHASSMTLRDALLRHFTITQPSGALLKLLADAAADADDGKALKAMLADDGPPLEEGIEILDLLKRFPSARPTVDAFVAALKPMRPRLYSISSSPKMFPDEVHLTCAAVRFLNPLGRQCKGVASTYLADRLRPGQKAKVFVHASHSFAPPDDGDVPMIMVGPGTGIAPFRAFLQDRVASSAAGRNWLFFGDQRREQDFLYRDELEKWLTDGVLTRLDVAFSRDQDEKVYVQHRMLERAREIWAWLQDGALFYVCGDAKRMARDVDAALKQIVAEQGGMSADSAAAYVSDLAKSRRYSRDVY